MAGNGWKGVEFSKSIWQFLEMAENDWNCETWFNMVEMAGNDRNGWKLLDINGNDWKWM